MVDSSEPAYSLPEYLYDNRLYNDVYYLLNKDVLFQDVTTVLEENANGTVEPMNKINSWFEGQKERFSRENVLRSLGELPDTFVKVEQQEAVVLGETVDSVKKVKDFVQKYPETTFQFFYSPYSMAYWYTSYATGIFLRDAENLEYSMKELLECKNVKLYFPFDYKVMSDFDHYKDWGHYDMEIQYQIFEKMVKGEDMLTMENYHDYMEEFRRMVMECDFEELFYILDE